MDVTSIIIGFLSGVVLSIFTAFINFRLSRKPDEYKALVKSKYEIYLKLNDLYNWYFWLVTNELHNKETDKETIETIHNIAVNLARELHKNENSEFTEKLLRILYDESYETFDARWKHISKLSEKLATKLLPNIKNTLVNYRIIIFI